MNSDKIYHHSKLVGVAHNHVHHASVKPNEQLLKMYTSLLQRVREILAQLFDTALGKFICPHGMDGSPRDRSWLVPLMMDQPFPAVLRYEE